MENQPQTEITEKELLEQQISGLKAKITQLKNDEKVFLKLVGLEEQIEQAKEEKLKLEPDMEEAKGKIAKMKSEKIKAISPTAQKLQKTMGQVLPTGKAIFNVDDDGNVHIGWHIKGGFISPYDGLSGSEKAIFDNALSYALLGDTENKIIVVEAGEIDEKNLIQFLSHLEKENPDAQIIVNHWYQPEAIKDDWNMITLKE